MGSKGADGDFNVYVVYGVGDNGSPGGQGPPVSIYSYNHILAPSGDINVSNTPGVWGESIGGQGGAGGSGGGLAYAIGGNG
ncbi:MAG: hypothetical protein N2596_08310, partial [Syntrophorhabdaceae bacterium]|nr:hypothetical protein [Syntrophorhabdaceae bacterium]